MITFVVLAAAGLTLLLAVPAQRQVLVDIRRASDAWLVLPVALRARSVRELARREGLRRVQGIGSEIIGPARPQR